VKNIIAICRFTQESFSLGMESWLGYTDSSKYSEYFWHWELFFWFTPLLVEE